MFCHAPLLQGSRRFNSKSWGICISFAGMQVLLYFRHLPIDVSVPVHLFPSRSQMGTRIKHPKMNGPSTRDVFSTTHPEMSVCICEKWKDNTLSRATGYRFQCITIQVSQRSQLSHIIYKFSTTNWWRYSSNSSHSDEPRKATMHFGLSQGYSPVGSMLCTSNSIWNQQRLLAV